MILKKALQSAKDGLTSLIIPLFIGILVGNTDMAKSLFDTIFPDQDSIGGVTFSLVPVPSAATQPSAELVLVRQSIRKTTRIDFLRQGSAGMHSVLAGIAADRAGAAIPLSGGVNGTRFLELEIPEKTLGGTSVMLTPGAAERARYVVTIENVTKDLSDPNDLIVYTKNEIRRSRILYNFVIATVAFVAFFVARAKPLTHHETPGEEAQPASDRA